MTPGSEERDSDGNVKVYKPETTVLTTTTTSTTTTSTSSSTLVVPMVQVGNRNSSTCSSISNSVNSNCHNTATSTSSTTNTSSTSGFFLGSDMTSAILAAGKLPAGTSLMSVLPGNNQNMFLSPMGLNLLGNNSSNKGCKTTCSAGTSLSNLATISGLGNLGNLSNLSIANLANLNNLTLSSLGNLSNLASISLSNKNASGSNFSANNFRNNVSLSVSMTNASTHSSQVTSTSSVSLASHGSSVSTVPSANSIITSSVVGVKAIPTVQESPTITDILKKEETDSASTVSANSVKEDNVPSPNNSTCLGNPGSFSNLSPGNHSPSVNNVSTDMNGSSAVNFVNATAETNMGNEMDIETERPAKIPKLDGTSVVTR